MSIKGQALLQLLEPLSAKYFISGEIHTKVSSMALVEEKLAGLEAMARRVPGASVYRMDGVSVEAPDWHFNVRASNTEPLLRLNLEATSQAVMEARRDEVVAFIRG